MQVSDPRANRLYGHGAARPYEAEDSKKTSSASEKKRVLGLATVVGYPAGSLAHIFWT